MSGRTGQESLGVVPGVGVLLGSQEVGDQDGASRHWDAPDTGRRQRGVGMYWDLLGSAGVYWDLLGPLEHTGVYWGLLGLTVAHWALLGSTGA